jgi:hypothetical protein
VGKRHVKNRNKAQDGTKLDYKVWASEFRPAVDELRHSMSWREIAVALGQNEGWAQAAYQHRGLSTDDHLRRLQLLVASKRRELDGVTGAAVLREGGVMMSQAALRAAIREIEAAGGKVTVSSERDGLDIELPRPPAPPPPDPEGIDGGLALPKAPVGEAARRRWYRAVIDELRGPPWGFLWDEVAKVFGYATGNSACSAYGTGSIPAAWRIERAEGILEHLRTGRTTEARAAMRAPQPLAKERALLGQQKHVEAPLERIGPPARPREVPKPAPVTPPSERPHPAVAQRQAAPQVSPKIEPVPPPVAPEPPAQNGAALEGLPRIKQLLTQAAEECEREAGKQPKAFRAPWHALRDELMEKLVGLE